jgi:type IV pilus assembly protein PilV
MPIKSDIKTRCNQGFTLLEVLIAMVIVAIGLIGLAKMQMLSVSATKDAGSRTLAAMHVSNLVSSMHSNKSYWASGAAPASFTASGTNITDSTHVLDRLIIGGCTSACSPADVASVDVSSWVQLMNSQFPFYDAKIDCTNNISQPVSCQIYVTWMEKTIAVNKTTSASASSQQESFSVFVEP